MFPKIFRPVQKVNELAIIQKLQFYPYPLKRAKSKSGTNGQSTWINKGVIVISMMVA